MIYRLGVEDMEPNNWVVWVFDLPGCYARGKTREAALEEVPFAIAEFLNWRAGYLLVEENNISGIVAEIAEEYHSRTIDNGYIVNAFFNDDRKTLNQEEVDETIWLLDCSRRDLMNVVRPLSPERLDQTIDGETQTNIRGILKHIAGAEWWYFDKFKLARDWSDIPDDVFQALDATRTDSLKALPGLVDDNRTAVHKEEIWSARKIVRRMLWHERVHTRQIEKYIL